MRYNHQIFIRLIGESYIRRGFRMVNLNISFIMATFLISLILATPLVALAQVAPKTSIIPKDPCTQQSPHASTALMEYNLTQPTGPGSGGGGEGVF